VPLLARPLLFLNKSFLNVTEGNSNNLVDAVGDKLNYLILVTNPGNVTLTDVSVFEPLTNLTLTGLTLAPNATQTYQTFYVLTQADLDNNGGGDGYIDNIVIADSSQTAQISDVESVPLLRSIALAFDKEFLNVTGGNGNALADFAGDALNFSFTVTNQGTVTLTNVVVIDAVTAEPDTGFAGPWRQGRVQFKLHLAAVRSGQQRWWRRSGRKLRHGRHRPNPCRDGH